MKIIYTRPDGGESVVTMVSQSSLAYLNPSIAGMTEQQYIDWVKQSAVPEDATNVRVVQDSDVPEQPIPDDVWNASIDAQLNAADLKIIRALTEGDTARVNAHKAAQAALRATRR